MIFCFFCLGALPTKISRGRIFQRWCSYAVCSNRKRSSGSFCGENPDTRAPVKFRGTASSNSLCPRHFGFFGVFLIFCFFAWEPCRQRFLGAELSSDGAPMPSAAIERGALVPSVVKRLTVGGQLNFEEQPPQVPLALAILASLENFGFF